MGSTDRGTVVGLGFDYTNVLGRSPVMAEQSSGLYVAIQPSIAGAVRGSGGFTEIYIPNFFSGGSNSFPAAPANLRIR